MTASLTAAAPSLWKRSSDFALRSGVGNDSLSGGVNV